MRRLILGLGEHSVWVHVMMALCVGLPVTILGLFVSWRVQVTQNSVGETQRVLQQVSAHIQSQNADTRRILSNQEEQLRILKGMGK